GARDGVARLAAAGARLAVVSNSDGTVAATLAALALIPEGVPVLDSATVGVAKPDPAIFALALARLGVPAARAVHVGDVPSADVVGARAAGVRPLHLDPIGWCGAGDHEHVAALGEVADLLAT
ncbi:HAD-IA family hydrolase, partial [Acidimicrobiaceae bacterium USS-CC1]|nr:HAD-IA family hydrolase [Acidiferrimicrobium australe]